MSEMTGKNEKRDLDLLLEKAREDTAAPSGALLERVMMDAHRVQDRIAAQTEAVVRPVHKDGWFVSLVTALGGWRTVSGLATATVAGVWLGYTPPAVLDDIVAGIWYAGSGYELGDFLASGEVFLVEG